MHCYTATAIQRYVFEGCSKFASDKSWWWRPCGGQCHCLGLFSVTVAHPVILTCAAVKHVKSWTPLSKECIVACHRWHSNAWSVGFSAATPLKIGHWVRLGLSCVCVALRLPLRCCCCCCCFFFRFLKLFVIPASTFAKLGEFMSKYKAIRGGDSKSVL